MGSNARKCFLCQLVCIRVKHRAVTPLPASEPLLDSEGRHGDSSSGPAAEVVALGVGADRTCVLQRKPRNCRAPDALAFHGRAGFGTKFGSRRGTKAASLRSASQERSVIGASTYRFLCSPPAHPSVLASDGLSKTGCLCSSLGYQLVTVTFLRAVLRQFLRWPPSPTAWRARPAHAQGWLSSHLLQPASRHQYTLSKHSNCKPSFASFRGSLTFRIQSLCTEAGRVTQFAGACDRPLCVPLLLSHTERWRSM